mmetsp:Transcript_13578/g.21176  ORF Transcript_13578/g.21176 Transcript_13578/m.21176 type:complete len:222 (+) Transcript_13578:101-766(+)|eukprot:CAMPEP_0195296314 /NCGR_PEP_ID=MMETSP0707-20130614/19172_1 /TAXON_ID=33640 /ORGANISM="Asterionellopsis glacialis, Strain CCMP134" /LENGTH=221 /DNA_ID=CAMNT_0040357781 /DNA_START=59 /DNA_END=724 /DNA_ORIENTATION=+
MGLGSTGAASASATKRKRYGGRHSHNRRIEIQTARLARIQRASDVFEKMSADGKSLSESKLEAFISEVMKVPKNELRQEAVQLVTDMLRNSNQGTGKSTSKLHSKDAVLRAIEKYGEYIKESEKIDNLFLKFDYNKDGELSRKELRNALEEHERKNHRFSNGVTIVLFVEEEDIDFILQQSDANKNGKISRNEVLPAIAAWEELASMKVEENNDGCACSIM